MECELYIVIILILIIMMIYHWYDMNYGEGFNASNPQDVKRVALQRGHRAAI